MPIPVSRTGLNSRIYRRHLNRNLSGPRREFNRIRQEVRKDLLQTSGVAFTAQVCGASSVNSMLLPAAYRTRRFDAGFQYRNKVDGR
jgi:hypothetical protein